jgi:hypothetical protein
MGKTSVIVVGAMTGLGAVGFYLLRRPPPGIEPKGPEEVAMWVSLATSFLGFATALVTFVLKLLEVRRGGHSRK